jgi:hypothetical protein
MPEHGLREINMQPFTSKTSHFKKSKVKTTQLPPNVGAAYVVGTSREYLRVVQGGE